MPDPDRTFEGLPRSIFVPQLDPRKGARDAVDAVLSDGFMAFLSILLLPIILLPFFGDLSAHILEFFDIMDVTIILFFVAEYLSKLYLAADRWEYFSSPWHLVDLAVVLLSGVSYLPLVGLQGKGSTSLLLRLLRLPRALAVGGRTVGSRVKVAETAPPSVATPRHTTIRQVGADLHQVQDNLAWEDLAQHLLTDDPEWIDLHDVTPDGIVKLSGLLRVPEKNFKTHHVDDIPPHIEYTEEMSFIFLHSREVRYPKHSEDFLRVARHGIVVISRGQKIISVSPHGADLFKNALGVAAGQRNQHSFVVSALYGIFDRTLEQYKSILAEIEGEVDVIGNIPKFQLPRDFLQRMYQMNKEVRRLSSNLVHLREVLGSTVSRRVPIEGFDEGALVEFKVLQEEASFLEDNAKDIADNLETIIDLYINQSSFETNRILKILAVITALSIIPAALGGILGMNLLDVPYPFDLWEVVLVIVMSMAFTGYSFYKLGWLKG